MAKTRVKSKQSSAAAVSESDKPTSGLRYLDSTMALDFEEAERAQTPLHAGWDEKESLLISKLADSISSGFKSKVTDSRLATIVLERSARVMAQIPTGVVQALTVKDKGPSAVMNLGLTKYIQPNDRAQFDHLTKMRMVDLYSQVYGVQAVLTDIDVREDYIGPGSWLIPIRYWFPQPGKISILDSDHNHVETWVSLSFLSAKKGKGSWNTTAIEFMEKKIAEGGGTSPTAEPTERRTVAQRDRENDVPGGQNEAGQIRMLTRYENSEDGKWITFLPGYKNLIVRECKSRTGRIPIRLKHHYPLLDSIYGLGAFERGKTLQFASDSLNAMYLAAVQMGIFPPRIIQHDGVVIDSLEYAPGATWTETKPQSIRNFEVSPSGLETFQSTSQWLTGAMLNQNGASDTSQTVQGSLDPQAGRTPQALKMQQQRESAADNWDRYMMETFLEGLYEDFCNLLPLVPKPFTMHIFDADIKALKDAGIENLDNYFEEYESGKAGELTLEQKVFGKNVKFKFMIDAGTTQQNDQAAEHEVYKEMKDAIVSAPQLIAAIQADGYDLHLGELFKQYIISGGTKDWEKIISKQEDATAQGGGQVQNLPAAADQGQALPPELAAAAVQGAQPPVAAPGQAAQPAQPAQSVQDILAGVQPAQPAAVEAPDPTKDPNHEFIVKWFDKLPIGAQRAIVKSLNLPSDGIFPAEADIVDALSGGTNNVTAQAVSMIPDIDPTSPYGSAVDPHAHLQASQDPALKDLYDAIRSTQSPVLHPDHAAVTAAVDPILSGAAPGGPAA